MSKQAGCTKPPLDPNKIALPEDEYQSIVVSSKIEEVTVKCNYRESDRQV